MAMHKGLQRGLVRTKKNTRCEVFKALLFAVISGQQHISPFVFYYNRQKSKMLEEGLIVEAMISPFSYEHGIKN